MGRGQGGAGRTRTGSRPYYTHHEVTGSYGGQINGVIYAVDEDTDNVFGYLEYGNYGGTSRIAMVEVSEDRRRQGVATRLVRELEREFPGDEIDWGMMTEEGAALREAVED